MSPPQADKRTAGSQKTMRFRREMEEEPRLGITPLIDIVFLLLIFFLLTSNFHMASGVPIRLPEIGMRQYQENVNRVILLMDQAGQMYVAGEKIHPNDLLHILQDRVSKEGVVSLLLQADKQVSHGKVVRAMDLAKSAGIRSIIIAAHWKADKED